MRINIERPNNMDNIISRMATRKKQQEDVYWERQKEVLDWVNEQ